MESAVENDKVNKCLLEGRDFIKQAAKAVGPAWYEIVPDAEGEGISIMLGNLGVQTYHACMSRTAPAKPEPADAYGTREGSVKSTRAR